MNELKIVKGNTFSTAIKVRAYTYDGEEITDFDLGECTTLKVYVHINESKTAIRQANYGVLQDNHLRINWPAEDLRLGKYALEVIGVYNNVDWRFYDKREIFEIVNTNAEANIPKESIIYDGFYSIGDESVQLISSIVNVHIDYVGDDNYVYKWDDSSGQYVKSDIYVKGADAIIEDGSITSEKLANQSVSGAKIKSGVINYQKLDSTLKSYMDKASNCVEVDDLSTQIIPALPEASANTVGKIYYIPKQSTPDFLWDWRNNNPSQLSTWYVEGNDASGSANFFNNRDGGTIWVGPEVEGTRTKFSTNGGLDNVQVNTNTYVKIQIVSLGTIQITCTANHNQYTYNGVAATQNDATYQITQADVQRGYVKLVSTGYFNMYSIAVTYTKYKNVYSLDPAKATHSAYMTINNGGNYSWVQIASPNYHVDLSEYEIHANKVTSISNTSTDLEYPSAKAVFDYTNGKMHYDKITSTGYKPLYADTFYFLDHPSGGYTVGLGVVGEMNTNDFHKICIFVNSGSNHFTLNVTANKPIKSTTSFPIYNPKPFLLECEYNPAGYWLVKHTVYSF